MDSIFELLLQVRCRPHRGGGKGSGFVKVKTVCRDTNIYSFVNLKRGGKKTPFITTRVKKKSPLPKMENSHLLQTEGNKHQRGFNRNQS